MKSSVGVDSVEAISLRNEEPYCASRPFDTDRDGMIPSGGAAALVLEEYEHAIARGATIIAEVCGYGFSSNGTEDISMPSAEAEFIAMQRALADANVQPAEIDYVNAHGTSTPVGDIEEAKALTRLFSGTKMPFVSSTKSMTGHLLGGSSAIEAVATVLTLRDGIIPPTINHFNDDPAIDPNIDIVYWEARKKDMTYAISNAFGFGGHNVSVIFKKYQ